MTPRTIESLFTEALQNQDPDDGNLDLTLEGPITKQILPRIIHAQIMVKTDPGYIGQEMSLPGFSFHAFDSMTQASLAYPNLGSSLAKPWSFWKFLQQPTTMIFDFQAWGAVVISPETLPQNEWSYRKFILGTWLSYALSPELWGTQGKWTRFHQRLQVFFEATDLLEEDPIPGHYRLKSRASVLREKGFIGTQLEKSYLLVLPWSFSLSSLERLETIVRQEF